MGGAGCRGLCVPPAAGRSGPGQKAARSPLRLPYAEGISALAAPFAEGAALGEESSAALQLLARQQEELRAARGELRAERARSTQLENDNMQLVARVSGAVQLRNQTGLGRVDGRVMPVRCAVSAALLRACHLPVTNALANPLRPLRFALQRWSAPTPPRPPPC